MRNRRKVTKGAKGLKEDPGDGGISVMRLTGLTQRNVKQLEKDGAISFFEKSDSILGQGSGSLVARSTAC
jgi:hypothetical protein